MNRVARLVGRTARWGLLPALTLCSLFATAPVRATGDLEPFCWTNPVSLSSITWAPTAQQATTNATAAAPTQSMGFDFGSSQNSSIICQFVVPGDYGTSALPTVQIRGYAESCVLCSNGSTKKVRFKVESFSADGGFTLNGSWVLGDTEDVTLDCETAACSGSAGTRADIALGVDCDGTTSVGNWKTNYVAFVKITRDTSVSDNLGATFHVNGVHVRYPN